MGAYTWKSVYYSTSDAEFRAWGKGISDAMAAIGMVQTADTGQIDWLTVTAPVVANTAQGYEIWRMDDPAQATCPIFIKLEYGSGSTTPSQRPNIWYTVGTGSNGSGTITGVTIQGRTAAITSTNGSVNEVQNWACYNAATGSFWLSIVPGASQAPGMFLGVFRWADANDAVSTLGATVITQAFAAGSCTVVHYRQTLASTLAGRGGWSVPFAQGSATLQYGLTLPVFYFYALAADASLVPCMGLFGRNIADFQPGAEIDITAYGATRNFICLPNTSSGNPGGTDQGNGTGAKVLLVYE